MTKKGSIVNGSSPFIVTLQGNGREERGKVERKGRRVGEDTLHPW